VKNTISILTGLLLTIIGSHNAFAAGNYECDNLDVVSGQYFLGTSYNVVVGVDTNKQVTDAMVFSRAVVPHSIPRELTLFSRNENPRCFSNGNTAFTLSLDAKVGSLSLNDGKVVLLCTLKKIGGAVTGSN